VVASSVHPEFASEQAAIEHAYACLEAMRESARRLQFSVESSAGGTHQARFERDVTFDRALERLSQLQIGSESLVFGRIDREPEESGERFYIGRLPVSDEEQNPVVVDWRAPVAAAFYRATGRDPQGLVRRRHFATEGPKLLAIDDEVFSADTLERGGDDLVGSAALLAALGRARSGHMRDIVATIQGEQDEIIRAELPGILVVQGGPGTGKTAVALHRASYLLYTHRFPLERQGVLVVGPNRLFMRYISRVLPSLGETGVELRAVDDLVNDLVHDLVVTGTESAAGARVKGDIRMARVIKRAVSTRQRPLKHDLVVGFGVHELRVTSAETADIIQTVKRGHRLHNASRRQAVVLTVERLYQRYQHALGRRGRLGSESTPVSFEDFSAHVRRTEEFRLALDRMWPLLTPTILLRDLFGSMPLIRAAAREVLTDEEQALLLRPRGASPSEAGWTAADVPLLDEAAVLLGPVDAKHADDHLRTYGHIVVDEAQDLSPMQLRMLARRSLNGSMTIVGDIGQATGMWAPHDWPEITRHLPARRAMRRVELTVGYRTPSEIMALAARVLEVAAPDLSVPRSVRSSGEEPLVVTGLPEEGVASVAARCVTAMQRAIGEGTIGVVVPDALADAVEAALHAAGVSSIGDGLSDGVSLVPVSRVKGLEFDGVVVVEPARMVREAPQGLRALFVALTRATRSLSIAHAEPLPGCLSAGD
jgi:DNA helicase IV